MFSWSWKKTSSFIFSILKLLRWKEEENQTQNLRVFCFLCEHTQQLKQVQTINKCNSKVISHLWSLHGKNWICLHGMSGNSTQNLCNNNQNIPTDIHRLKAPTLHLPFAWVWMFSLVFWTQCMLYLFIPYRSQKKVSLLNFITPRFWASDRNTARTNSIQKISFCLQLNSPSVKASDLFIYKAKPTQFSNH